MNEGPSDAREIGGSDTNGENERGLTKRLTDDGEYIHAHRALSLLTRVAKSEEHAKKVLIEALSQGLLRAVAGSITTDWDIGRYRNSITLIDEYRANTLQSSPDVRLKVDKSKFSKTPKGARLVVNWKIGRFVWWSPPGKLRRLPTSGRICRDVSQRTRMAAVEFFKQDFAKILIRYEKNKKISNHSVANRKTRDWTHASKWRTKLSYFYDLLDNNDLGAECDPDTYGRIAILARRMASRCNNTDGDIQKYRKQAKLVLAEYDRRQGLIRL